MCIRDRLEVGNLDISQVTRVDWSSVTARISNNLMGGGLSFQIHLARALCDDNMDGVRSRNGDRSGVGLAG